ncbi:MAG: phosphopantetheine-binding protein [Planctomycetota bacterium]
MSISSRTPEGEPNRCPVCLASIVIEPSSVFGDAVCPRCGSLLWFLNLPTEARVFERSDSDEVRNRVAAIVARQLGVDPRRVEENEALLNGLGADSLDVVELVMDLEEELDSP